MSKRSSPNRSDGSDDSQSGLEDLDAKRRRLVDFESVRLLSVSGVNDIDEKKAKVQAYKLSELVRHKNKQLKGKDREIERLRQRQMTDENTSCTINRHWNNLDEQMRLIALRGASSEDVAELLEGAENVEDTYSRDFLGEIVQMEGDEGETVYDKRVQFSVQLLDKVMQQSARKAEQFRLLSRKMSVFMEASTSNENRDTALCEQVAENARLADENSRLHREANRLQLQLAQTRLRLKEEEDKGALLTTRNEELLREIDEARFDLDKALRQVNKLDYKLYTMVKEQSSIQSEAKALKSRQNGVSNGIGIDAAELDDLKAECEINADLAANRLQEIRELNEKIQKYAEDTARMEMCLKTALESSDAIKKSQEYQNLVAYYSIVIDECRRLRNDFESVTAERDLLRQEMIQKVQEMKDDEQQSMRKMMSSSEKINRDHMQVRTEYDMLRMEFEQSLAAQGRQDAKQNDVKILFGSLKTQNYQLKSDVNKYKKKWKDGVNMLLKSQKELDTERRRLDKCLVIELEDDDSNELASPDQSRDDLDVDEDGLESESSLRSRILELKLKLEVYADIGADVRDKAELLVRERRLKLENERLLHQIKRLGNMERKEKLRYFETEAARNFAQKDAEIERLKKEAAVLKDTEASLMLDLDNTGSALEDLQEQNAKLVAQQKEHDESQMKLMNDRIVASQIQQKVKEEMAHLESQVQNLTRQMQAQQCEKDAMTESLRLAQETIGVKTKENLRLNRLIEGLRKQVTEQALNTADLGTRNDKIAAQLREMQEVVVSKTSQHEVIEQRRRRLEEENSTMKKRLERVKKSEKLGSTDAVLMEEIRELKDVLTCPSCKVNRKDAILTKCFHVFCMKCLKTRYDTRQRKCPKCNAGFGANDFHRVYIG